MTTDTHPKPDPEREAFEAFARNVLDEEDFSPHGTIPGAYWQPDLQRSWLSWQAGKARSSSIPAGDVGKVVEALARVVYEQWQRTDGWVPWVEGGNSIKQGDARRIVLAALASLRGAALLPQMTPVAWQAREMLDEDWSHWRETRGEDLERWRSRVARRPDLYELRPLYTTPPGLEGDSQKDANHG